MTGTIAIFNSASTSGLISTEDGLRIHFDSTGVLAYDIANLAVGRLVTFDLLPGRNPEANNVCVERLRTRGANGCHEALPLRYMGFEQSGSTRTYRFIRTQIGEKRTTVIVTADLSLFTRHHVGIQEGPNLCLQLLAAAMDAAGLTSMSPPYALGDAEMLVYLANRPLPGKTVRFQGGAGLCSGRAFSPGCRVACA